MLVNKMKKAVRKSLTFSALSTLALGLISEASFAQNKLIGYIPSYADMVAVADRTDLTKLTHVKLAFLNPNASGAVANGTNPVCMLNGGGQVSIAGSEITSVVNKAHAAGAKVLISVAGGGIPFCSGNWRTLLQPGSRTTLVNNIVNYVNTMNIDGVDVDLEGDLLTSIDGDGNYIPFIQALRNALPGKLVTAATDSYNGGMLPIGSIQYFDFVSIMSYDGVGPNRNVGGENASLEKAQTDINTWVGRGLPKSKLVLGVPFYGLGFAGMPVAMSFRDIVATYGAAAAQSDVVGNRCAGCAYITYNGIPTIREKTKLALQYGSGVMIWELSHDGSGANSLLSAIRTQMGSTGSSSSSSSTNGGSCPAWVEGRQYNVGDKVSYQGAYYIAEFANPGYNPTISTYFWEPVAASACGTTSSSSSSTAAFTRLIQAETYASMSGVQLEDTRDTGLGQNVGWIDTADWMSYTNINIPTSGSYRIEYRVASINGGTLAANLNTNAIQFPAVSFSGTGDWQNWTTVSQTVNINAGTYTFGVYASTGGWNINWIRFTKI